MPSLNSTGLRRMLPACVAALAVLAAAPADAATTASDIVQVNLSPTGEQPSFPLAESWRATFGAAANANGRFVAFASFASNLVPDDINNNSDIFVRDTVAGTTVRASVPPAGQNDLGGYLPSISHDGRYVAYEAPVYTSASEGARRNSGVYLRDLVAGVTTPISASDRPGDSAWGASISADGRYVAFVSRDSDLVPGDTNDSDDVFVRDMATGVTARVNVAAGGEQANKGSGDHAGSPSLSADGRYVAFTSWASNLVPGDTNDSSDVFVRDTVAGTTVRASVASDGTQTGGATDADLRSQEPSISADGRYVAFESYAENLVSGDRNGERDVFVRDLVGGTTSQVSAAPGEGGDYVSMQPSISADGRYIAFASRSTNLVDGPTYRGTHIYVKDQVAGTITRANALGTRYLRSNVAPSISADGRAVAYESDSLEQAAAATGTYRHMYLRRLG